MDKRAQKSKIEEKNATKRDKHNNIHLGREHAHQFIAIRRLTREPRVALGVERSSLEHLGVSLEGVGDINDDVVEKLC